MKKFVMVCLLVASVELALCAPAPLLPPDVMALLANLPAPLPPLPVLSPPAQPLPVPIAAPPLPAPLAVPPLPNLPAVNQLKDLLALLSLLNALGALH